MTTTHKLEVKCSKLYTIHIIRLMSFVFCLLPTKQQKGFSALSLFFMGLILLILMNFTGFFTHPKSPITDSTVYTASGSGQLDGKGLHMVDVYFETATLMPPPPTSTLQPTPLPQPIATPTPTSSITPTRKPTSPPVPSSIPTDPPSPTPVEN